MLFCALYIVLRYHSLKWTIQLLHSQIISKTQIAVNLSSFQQVTNIWLIWTHQISTVLDFFHDDFIPEPKLFAIDMLPKMKPSLNTQISLFSSTIKPGPNLHVWDIIVCQEVQNSILISCLTLPNHDAQFYISLRKTDIILITAGSNDLLKSQECNLYTPSVPQYKSIVLGSAIPQYKSIKGIKCSYCNICTPPALMQKKLMGSCNMPFNRGMHGPMLLIFS